MRGSNGLSGLILVSSLGALVAGCSAIIDTDTSKLAAGSPQMGKCAHACDDGIPCTIDECGTDNVCHYRPSAEACDDGIGCTEDICDPMRGCSHKESDERCQFCAPGSTCNAKVGGCIGFTQQRNCDDKDPCTKDACSVAEMMCTSTDVDADADGFAAVSVNGTDCGGDDCDDSQAGVNPKAIEACNGRDDNCDGRVDEDCQDTPDTCESAVTLMFKGETGMIEGSFAQVQPNFDVSCGSNNMPDAVYHLALGGSPVDIVLESMQDSAEVVLAAGASCGDAGFQLGCAEPLSSGTTRLAFHRYQKPELFILVDAKNKNESKNYRIKVSVTAVAGDTCLPTAFDYSNCGTLVGVMPEGQGQLQGSCQGGLFPRQASESVVRMTPTAKVTVRATSSEFSPTLYAREGCGPFSSDAVCNAPQGGNGEAKIDLDPSRGAMFVVVDGAQPGQSFTLTCSD